MTAYCPKCRKVTNQNRSERELDGQLEFTDRCFSCGMVVQTGHAPASVPKKQKPEEPPAH